MEQASELGSLGQVLEGVSLEQASELALWELALELLLEQASELALEQASELGWWAVAEVVAVMAEADSTGQADSTGGQRTLGVGLGIYLGLYSHPIYSHHHDTCM